MFTRVKNLRSSLDLMAYEKDCRYFMTYFSTVTCLGFKMLLILLTSLVQGLPVKLNAIACPIGGIVHGIQGSTGLPELIQVVKEWKLHCHLLLLQPPVKAIIILLFLFLMLKELADKYTSLIRIPDRTHCLTLLYK